MCVFLGNNKLLVGCVCISVSHKISGTLSTSTVEVQLRDMASRRQDNSRLIDNSSLHVDKILYSYQ